MRRRTQSEYEKHLRRHLVWRAGSHDLTQRMTREQCRLSILWYRRHEPNVRMPRSIRRKAGFIL